MEDRIRCPRPFRKPRAGRLGAITIKDRLILVDRSSETARI